MWAWWTSCSLQLWFLNNRQVTVGDSVLCCDLLCPQPVTLNFRYPEFRMTLIKGDSVLCCDLLCPQPVTLNFRYPEFRMTLIKGDSVLCCDRLCPQPVTLNFRYPEFRMTLIKGDSVLDCDLMYHLQLHAALVDFMYRSRTLHYLNARWHWQWVIVRFGSLLCYDLLWPLVMLL